MVRLHIIDEVSRRRALVASLANAMGMHAEVYEDIHEFFKYSPPRGVILIQADGASDAIGDFVSMCVDKVISLPVVAYSEDPRPRQIVDAVKAGVADFLNYPFDQYSLNECLRQLDVAQLEDSQVVQRLLAQTRLKKLTNRESEVLRCVSLGETNKAIAAKLGISPRTVEIHRANLMTKLGVRTTAEVLRIRFEAGLTEKLVRH